MRSFLPNEIQAWQLQDSSAAYDRKTIFDYIDGAGEVFLAYDFRTVEVFHYAQVDWPDIKVEIFDMGSDEEAYGIFSHSREEEMTGIGRAYEYRSGLLCFWQDRHFVCVGTSGLSSETKEPLLELARDISARLPQGGRVPGLVSCLPDSGLIPGTTRYFHRHTSLNAHYYLHSDNILNLGVETRCVLARYDHGYLLCVEYPSPEDAEQGFAGLVRDYAPALAKSDAIELAADHWLAARVNGPSLFLVLEAGCKAEGLTLISACEESMQALQTQEVNP